MKCTCNASASSLRIVSFVRTINGCIRTSDFVWKERVGSNNEQNSSSFSFRNINYSSIRYANHIIAVCHEEFIFPLFKNNFFNVESLVPLEYLAHELDCLAHAA